MRAIHQNTQLCVRVIDERDSIHRVVTEGERNSGVRGMELRHKPATEKIVHTFQPQVP